MRNLNVISASLVCMGVTTGFLTACDEQSGKSNRDCAISTIENTETPESESAVRNAILASVGGVATVNTDEVTSALYAQLGPNQQGFVVTCRSDGPTREAIRYDTYILDAQENMPNNSDPRRIAKAAAFDWRDYSGVTQANGRDSSMLSKEELINAKLF